MQRVVSLLIVTYLFLGGAGAGSFAVLACIDFLHLKPSLRPAGRGASARVPSQHAAEGRRLRLLTKRGHAASFAVLALGAVCLLADLGRPEIAHLLFTRPTPSLISVGTYSLTVLMTCALFLALIANFSLPRAVDRARPVALAVGLLAAVLVMAYTGMLLQSLKAVDLWDSPLLAVLFFLSALSTGIAVVMLCANGLGLRRTNARVVRRLSVVDLAIIVAELVVCAAYLAAVSDTEAGVQSVRNLLVGEDAAVFVAGFAACGLAVPGTLNAVAMARGNTERLDLAIACSILVGGFCLRLGLFQARIHSGM